MIRRGALLEVALLWVLIPSGPAAGEDTLRPGVNNEGVGYTRFDNVVATGRTASSAGAVSNVINIEKDDIDVEGSGHGAYYSGLTVQDLNFGGAGARGGRIVVGGSLKQTAPSAPFSILRDYVGLQGYVDTATGDGGAAEQAKGQYYGIWSVANAGPGAHYVDAVLGEEIDLSVQADSEVNNKSGIMVNHGGPNGARDAVQGAKNDNLFWAWGAPRHIGSRFGFQFGRADIHADYGVARSGTLVGTLGTASVAYGINIVSADCLTACWASRGALIDGAGNAQFARVTSTFREPLRTPSRSSDPCLQGEFTDDANYHYVCVTNDRWRRVALSDF